MVDTQNTGPQELTQPSHKYKKQGSLFGWPEKKAAKKVINIPGDNRKRDPYGQTWATPRRGR